MDELANKSAVQSGAMPYLSDHAFQSASFSFYTANDQLILSVKGGTWNLQNKGFAKHPDFVHSYSNNPWNIEENISDYIHRKKHQIDKIVNNLIVGKDFIFLQEIDFLPSPTSQLSQKKVNSLPPDVKQELRQLLETKLKKYDWKILISSQKKLKAAKKWDTQPLALLYNERTMFYTIKSRGLFEHQHAGFRGYEWMFFHRFSGQHLALTNIHLLYDINYRSLIAQYQAEQIHKNMFTVMGGDTNHPANQLPGAMSANRTATNLEQRDNYLALSHQDHRYENAIKDYDLFFVMPAQYTYFKSVENESECFKLVSEEES